MVGIVESSVDACDGGSHRTAADLLEKGVTKLEDVVIHHEFECVLNRHNWEV
jgi:hypothetical protein